MNIPSAQWQQKLQPRVELFVQDIQSIVNRSEDLPSAHFKVCGFLEDLQLCQLISDYHVDERLRFVQIEITSRMPQIHIEFMAPDEDAFDD